MPRRTRVPRPPTHTPQPTIDAVDLGLRSAGRPLDEATQADARAAFPAHDFSQVRIHANDDAAQSAAALRARAWTAGRDIIFGAQHFAPGTSAGRELVRHELAHVAQQGAAAVTSATEVDLREQPALEAQAIATATGRAPFLGRAAGPLLQRADDEDTPPPPEAGQLPGAPTVEPPGVDPLSGDSALTSEQAMAQVYSGQDAIAALRDEIVQTLLPAYRKAVDALDPEGAVQLAGAALLGLHAAEKRHSALEAKVQGWRNSAAGEPISVGEVPDDIDAIDADLETELTFAAEALAQLKQDMFIELGPQHFRDVDVAGSLTLPSGTPSANYIASEAATVSALLLTVRQVREQVGEEPAKAAPTQRTEAARLVGTWQSRPINIRFLERVLTDEGIWVHIAAFPAEGVQPLSGVLADARDQAAETGNLTDVGEFDMDSADAALSRSALDWSISDDDAMSVYRMVMSAPRTSRLALMEQLDRAGKFDRLIENLPWRRVKELHDSIAVRGMGVSALQERMANRIGEESGGESLTKEYEAQIMQNIADDDLVGAFGWTYLKTAHSALTMGFLDIHDAAYDAREEGYISSDAYMSTATKAAARSAILLAATAATGGAAGMYAEGAALGLGAGRTTAMLIGAGVGGGAAGIGGQFTADVFDQALLDKEGFSSAEDYALAGALGMGTGLLTGGVQAAGSKYLPASAKSMSQVYAERYPMLDNVLTRMRGSGVRSGLRVRVTAQELVDLTKAGLVGNANLNDALRRIGAVYQNERIDISTETLSKVHPQSEIEQMYGTVDPVTGQVTVTNQTPSSAGFVGKSSDLAAQPQGSDAATLHALGIDNPATPYYQKYHSGEPLFEVVMRTSVELDVPLPQANAPGINLGAQDPVSLHMPGTGRTAGGVAEGTLPRGAVIEIVEIRPVGDPHSAFPATGAQYKPFPPAAPSVRNPEAPTSGAVSGPTSGAGRQDDE